MKREPRPWRRVGAVRLPLALAGAAAMLTVAIRELPEPHAWFRKPYTPLARSNMEWSGREYRILTEAARVIPAGATVLVGVGTGEAWREDLTYRFGVALLPGRRVLPAVVGGQPPPNELAAAAEFVVLVGGRPPDMPGEKILATGDGTVWRRRNR